MNYPQAVKKSGIYTGKEGIIAASWYVNISRLLCLNYIISYMHSPYTFDTKLQLLESMIGGDLSLKRELIDSYLRDLSKMKRQLSKAFGERDFVSLKRVFHTLKSNAKMLGSDSLSALSLVLEKTSAGKDLKKIAALLPEFNRQIEMHQKDLIRSMKSFS